MEDFMDGLIRFNKRFLDDKLDVSAFVGANMMQYKMTSTLIYMIICVQTIVCS
ncbi:hypothetical protein [Dysgonomonas sp. 511]|uniref:hypothetical protein n=1 Tax=Dysgonomonas sp. 511 TaxID=2302930 RepID=UPI0013D2B11B|nr:hypothetical protein [Dysgonomonas sp. 511]